MGDQRCSPLIAPSPQSGVDRRTRAPTASPGRLKTLKAILDFLLNFMACRLRAKAAAPASSVPSVSPSLNPSSALEHKSNCRTNIGTGRGAGAGFEVPAMAPLLQDSMEFRKDLSVSVLQALSHRCHTTTYRRAGTQTHSRYTPTTCFIHYYESKFFHILLLWKLNKLLFCFHNLVKVRNTWSKLRTIIKVEREKARA